ncbi:MAG: class I SAM-dependent methyltransferase [Planctomycetes bacterium]|nr:class I SAM-dependent methyltransferase [Planctomycetota bacterium]
MSEPAATEPPGYRLLDTGGGARLEEVGGYRLARPAPQAVWGRSLPESEWAAAAGRYTRDDSGGGAWNASHRLPDEWPARCGGLTLLVKPTGFGHLGLFPEQVDHWRWLLERLPQPAERSGGAAGVLNLFGYTGGATLALARAGAALTHVDASSGAVDWGQRNAAANGLDAKPVRWLVEEAAKFVRREQRRGRRYHGVILDPPTFGRGPKGEVWKIEADLPPLLAGCVALLAEEPLFVHLSCHTPGFTPRTLANLIEEALLRSAGARCLPNARAVECGEMLLAAENGPPLPCGAFARWAARAVPLTPSRAHYQRS